MRALQLSKPFITCRAFQLHYHTTHLGCHSNQRHCCHAVQGGLQQELPVLPQADVKQLDPHSHNQYPRFYSPQLPAGIGMSVELDPEEAKHAVRVLRLQPGDIVELCDGRGGLVLCEVAATSRSSAMLTTTAEPQHSPWCGPKWVVAAACLTLKGGRTDWLVEKATELGAHALLPLITARSQTGTNKDKFKALAQKAGQKKRQRAASDDTDGADSSSSSSDFQPSRLERLAVAATKQSLRTHGLQVLPAVSLDQLLPQLQAAPVSLVAMGGAPPVLQVLRTQWQHAQQQQQHSQQAGSLAQQQASSSSHPWDGAPCYLLIGPEGDFTPDEVARLSAAGVLPVGLGPHRLRTETAAIAALTAAVLMSDSQGGRNGV